MQLWYNYRLHPTPGQRTALARAFGCAGRVQRRAGRPPAGARGRAVAHRNFFASLTGTGKGPGSRHRSSGPAKDRRQAIRFTRNARFAVTADGKLRLPKIGDIAVRWSRDLPSAPSSVTVIQDAVGRYFASFVVQAAGDPLPQAGAEAGIDLGLTHFAVLSDGRKISNPRFLRRAERSARRRRP